MLNKFTRHLKQRTLFSQITLNSIYLERSIKNILSYGLLAPRAGEVIVINPRNCFFALPVKDCLCQNMDQGLLLKNPMKQKVLLGQVIETAWPEECAIPLTNVPRIKYCIDHWVKNKPWVNTGAYEFQLKFRGRSKEQIVKKFEHLDRIFEQVKYEGRFRTKNEINIISDSIKSTTMGCIVHIGPNGELFFGGTSNHRFAIAYILKIPFPALVGLVHVSAIPYLAKYRRDKLPK